MGLRPAKASWLCSPLSQIFVSLQYPSRNASQDKRKPKKNCTVSEASAVVKLSVTSRPLTYHLITPASPNQHHVPACRSSRTESQSLPLPPFSSSIICQSVHRLTLVIGTKRRTTVDGRIHFVCQSRQGSGQWAQTCQYWTSLVSDFCLSAWTSTFCLLLCTYT